MVLTSAVIGIHEAPPSDPAADIDEIERLIARLERGLVVIEGTRQSGLPVDDLEDRWIRMLRRYEELCDRQAA